MRVFLAVLSLCIVSQPAWAEMDVKGQQKWAGRWEIIEFCVDGLKFLIGDKVDDAGAVTIVQVYEERDGKTLPALCQMN